MNNHLFRRILRLVPVAIAFAAAACGNSDGLSGPAHLRLLNLSSGYDSLDLLSNNGDTDVDKTLFTGVQEKTISDYTSFKADTFTFKYRKTGVTSDLLVNSQTVADGTHTTYVGYGKLNQFAVLAINEDGDDPDSGYTRIQVLNTTLGGRFDVYLTGATDSLDDTAATIASVSSGSGSSTTKLAGSYRLRVANGGSKTDIRLDVPNLTFANKGIYNIILTETDGGVLVNAVLLPQQGQPTFFGNTASASVRLLNVSSGYTPIDLFTTDSSTTSSTETKQFGAGAIPTGSITDYSSIKADTYNLLFRKTGSSGNLLSQTSTLGETTHTTYVAFGTTNHFAMLPISEDVEAPNDGYTKLQVFNTTAGDALDVYLSGPTDSINDISPTLSAALPGVQSPTTTVKAGTYRLRVTLAGSKTDIRLDTSTIVLPAANAEATPVVAGVVSLILSETGGGVLVNAVALPQQGAADVHNNNTVRVRGASGLSVGSAVTIGVSGTGIAAGTNIVTNRGARNYIGDTYTILPAGAVTFTITVDGVVASTTTSTLVAGQDYTLLAYDSGTGVAPPVQTTLIADDNHAPTTGYSKVRLINGMSGLKQPLNLSINFSPVAEYINVGTASAPFEFIPVAANQNEIDVTNANDLTSILSRDTLTLTNGSVYTFFAAGGGTSGVAGTLRKDR